MDDFEGGPLWPARDEPGAPPVQDCSTAASGRCSLRLSVPNARVFEAGANLRGGMVREGYSTAPYPFMCMSY